MTMPLVRLSKAAIAAALIAASGAPAHAAAVGLAEFDRLTVSISGAGLRYLSPFGVSSSKTARANGVEDDHPTISFPLPLPVVDPRIADEQNGGATAEAQEHTFAVTTMTFDDYLARAVATGPEKQVARAFGLGSLDFLVVGDPTSDDSVTISYMFEGANVVATAGAYAYLDVRIFGGLDFRDFRFETGDTIAIPPVTVSLGRFEGDELLGVSVIPDVYAEAVVPLPGTMGLLLSGLFGTGMVLRRHKAG